MEVVARQIPSRSRPATGHRSAGRNYVVRTAGAAVEKASILYSRQELAERLRLAWKHREENKANIDIFLAHGFAVEERCGSELSMSAPPTPLPRKDPIPDPFDQNREKVSGWSTKAADEREMPNNVLGESADSRDGSLENEEGKLERGIGDEESETACRMAENDATRRKNEEDAVEKSEECAANVDEKRKTRISIDCTSLHSPKTSQSASFPSLKSENTAQIATKAPCNDFSSAKQKRASFRSGTNRAFLVPMIEKPTKGIAETNKYPSTEKIVPPVKLAETRCASVDKSTVLAKNFSTLPEKTKRTNSAPPQKRAGATAAPATRMQVNIVIDAPGFAESTDKSAVCGFAKNAMEKSEDDLTKVEELSKLPAII